MPSVPTLCTLEASSIYLPALDRRRLTDCCAAVGVRHDSAHSALGDARATAHLLASYLNHRCGRAALYEHVDLPNVAQQMAWPAAPTRQRVVYQRTQSTPASWTTRRPKPVPPRLVELLDTLSLSDVLDEGAPTGSLAYLELLAQALEDGQLTAEEHTALAEAASVYDLHDNDIELANRSLLMALAHHALADGKVSQAERAELNAIADLLNVDRRHVKTVLDHAEAARLRRMSTGLRPLPEEWHLGEPLRVGQKVAFTGCNAEEREQLEQQAEQLGVRVVNAVSRKTAIVVTDGTFDGTKAETARELGIRIVHPNDFKVLLEYLQPV
jgi:DNA polymerase-3 subunit epsilon